VTVQKTEQLHAFLSTELPRVGDKRFARLVVVLSVLAFLGGVAFVRTPLMPMPAFIPAYEAALWINDTLTAVLLFGQFTRLRSRALLVLATGYLFDGFMVIPHALSFPGAFSATGLLGGGTQTTAWLYVFWHGGFPLFVLAFALLSRRAGDTVRSSPARAIAIAVAGIAATCVALTVVATIGHDMLPEVIRDSDYSMLVTKGISPAIWGLSAGALLVLWRRDNPTVLDLWLMVAMVAWLLDIGFAAVIGSHRFDLGFYAGRSMGCWRPASCWACCWSR
jgi:two-component system sensor histidine kinase/response regulator